MSKRGKKSEEEMESTLEDEEDEDDVDVKTMLANLAKDVAKLNKNIAGMQDSLSATIAEAVYPITKRMDRMEKKQISDMVDLRSEMDSKIKDAVEKERSNNAKKKNVNPNSYAGKAASSPSDPAGTPTSSASGNRQDTTWYWDARKRLRFFPVPGNNDEQLLRGLDEFVQQKLKVPSGLLDRSDIGYIRRVKATKRSKIANEVLVSFTSIDARDLVHSYARNLAEWVGEDGKPLAGIRLDIPERLLGDFKSCEQYGHAMKTKHGDGFKRHTKMDDTNQSIYIDMYIPKSQTWVRVDMDMVRRDNKDRQSRKPKVSEEDLMSK